MFPNSGMKVRASGLWVPEHIEDDFRSAALRAAMSMRALLPATSANTPIGDVMATHTVSAKEYQAVIPCHASGHMRGTIPTYSWWRPFTAGAANQRVIDIFNAVGSGVTVKLRKLFLHHNQATVTGVPVNFDLSITSAAGTGGTTITGRKMDSVNDPNIPAAVTARYNATGGATVSYDLCGISVHTEETLPATGLAPMINWLAEGEDIGDIVLNPGEGFLVEQITSTTVGVWGCWVVASIL